MSSIAVDAGQRDSRADPADQKPLTEDERKFVSRMFSDPFAFPQMYKTWLIAFLEGSDLSLPLSSILGLSSLLGGGGGGSPGIFKLLPAGMVFAWAGTAAPQGTFECNGQALNRLTYDRMFKAIGTRWGAGDGTSTFNVPDLRKRAPFGAGTGYAVGQTDGVPEANRGGQAHNHHFIDTKGFDASGGTDWEGDHQHNFTYPQSRSYREGQQAYIGFAMPDGYATPTTPNGGHDHGVGVSGSIQISGNTSGGGQQDLISHAVVMYVING